MLMLISTLFSHNICQGEPFHEFLWWTGMSCRVGCKQWSVDPCCFECLFHVYWDSLRSDNIVFKVTDNNFFCRFYVFNGCASWENWFLDEGIWFDRLWVKQSCGISNDFWYVKYDFININAHMSMGKDVSWLTSMSWKEW